MEEQSLSPKEVAQALKDDLINSRHMTIAKAAEIMQKDPRALYNIMKGRFRIGPRMAGLLHDAFGYSVTFLTKGTGTLYGNGAPANADAAVPSALPALYPIGIQDFETIRRDGYIYVDKTRHIWQLVTTGKFYFLSRPRRFGKSLLLSTMEAYFSGRKELFDGLAIAGLEKDWIPYPVLHLDLSAGDYTREGSLERILSERMKKWESQYGLTETAQTLPSRFIDIVDAVRERTGLPIVFLVDEYDKPVIDNLENETLADRHRTLLKSFYETLKNRNGHFKFAFLTGVTKLGKMSVFSALNNLRDLSLEAETADICGITAEELKSCFGTGIREMALANGMPAEACLARLERTYDGYHFHPNAAGVYNPFSLLSALRSKEFRHYWSETGTPASLVKVIRETDFDISGLRDEKADSTLLTDIDTVYSNPIPLLYQSGYLTITGYDADTGIYTLGFPNLEVKHGFLSYLLNYYTSAKGAGGLLIRQMGADLLAGRPADFMKRMESFFAGQNYQIQGSSEKDFQYAMSVILQLLGDSVTVRTEDPTSDGRIDIAIETPGYVYIIEIKRDESAEAALRQIEERQYAKKYVSDARRLFKVGVNFSTESRSIESWKVAE